MRRSQVTRAYAFRCPDCGAPPGELCRARFGRGGPWIDTHAKRRRLVYRRPLGPMGRAYVARGALAVRQRRQVLAAQGNRRVLAARPWLAPAAACGHDASPPRRDRLPA